MGMKHSLSYKMQNNMENVLKLRVKASRVIARLLIKETQCDLLHLGCQWGRF